MPTQTLLLLALAALCFTVWPFLMNQSRLHYIVAALILNSVSALVFVPFLKSAAQQNNFTGAAITWGLGAGLINGFGHLFFQKVVVSSIEPSRFITVILVMQVVVATAIAFGLSLTTSQAHVAEPFTMKKFAGAIAAIAAIILLTNK